MKTILIGTGLLVLALAASPRSQTVTTRTVMRDKLAHTQRVLESIMTSNFEQLERETAALARNTEAPGWAVLNSPEYVGQSQSFRAALQDLRSASMSRDLDAAAERYATLTQRCYQCHRYLKGARIARP